MSGSAPTDSGGVPEEQTPVIPAEADAPQEPAAAEHTPPPPQPMEGVSQQQQQQLPTITAPAMPHSTNVEFQAASEDLQNTLAKLQLKIATNQAADISMNDILTMQRQFEVLMSRHPIFSSYPQVTALAGLPATVPSQQPTFTAGTAPDHRTTALPSVHASVTQRLERFAEFATMPDYTQQQEQQGQQEQGQQQQQEQQQQLQQEYPIKSATTGRNKPSRSSHPHSQQQQPLYPQQQQQHQQQYEQPPPLIPSRPIQSAPQPLRIAQQLPPLPPSAPLQQQQQQMQQPMGGYEGGWGQQQQPGWQYPQEHHHQPQMYGEYGIEQQQQQGGVGMYQYPGHLQASAWQQQPPPQPVWEPSPPPPQPPAWPVQQQQQQQPDLSQLPNQDQAAASDLLGLLNALQQAEPSLQNAMTHLLQQTLQEAAQATQASESDRLLQQAQELLAQILAEAQQGGGGGGGQ